MRLVSLSPEIEALLFDLDGTLVDTAAANALAYVRALEEFGIAADAGELQKQAAGRNWRQFLPPLVHASGVEVNCALVAERKSVLYASMVAGLPVNSTLMALLLENKPHRRIGLVTTASRRNADAICAAQGWTKLFDTVVTGDDVLHHKPAPDAYLLAASCLDLEPASCMALEDSDMGVQSALAAGMAVFRVEFER